MSETPAKPRPSFRRRAIIWGAAGLCTAALAGGSALVVQHITATHDAEVADAAKQLKHATSAVEAEATRVKEAAAAVLPRLAEAEQKLVDSEGRTLDDAARQALRTAIDQARTSVDAVGAEADAAVDSAKTVKVDHSYFAHADNLRAAAKRVTGQQLPDPASLEPVVTALDVPKQQVDAAIAAWEVQRERDSAYVEYVRTAGYQGEIDACSDSVDITDWYGTPTVAEHWSCGGVNFPRETGTLVHFTGQVEGFYRVVGIPAYLNVYTDSLADVPGGYDLLYQTCIDGQSTNMAMVALERVD
ncbi:hypothetical protein [Agromyces humi]|uniref:hypothetical protein n=1 Tax=Agromyces humi TaxID=1766800 RepID=UPI00135B48FE|nr:hypothetical protein [Agromyces humi]